MTICYNGRTKKRAVTCSLYGLCMEHSPNFMPKKFLKNSKIIVDLVPKRDYVIYNKRETEGQTSAQRRETK